MFRDVPQLAPHWEVTRLYGGAAPAARSAHPLRAALLDAVPSDRGPAKNGPQAQGQTEQGQTEQAHEGTAAANGRVTGPHLLAAGTAAAALADMPASGRPSSRAAAIVANLPELGGPDLTNWVNDRLGLSQQAWAPRHSCSLRAIATACELLSAGQLDLVVAGGVSMGVDPVWLAYRAQSGGLSGRDVRVYDVSPTGTLPGEGCGMVVLMRAEDARAGGLGAYAEIAGWEAADDDAPSAAIRGAYLRSGIDPADVQYIEGHGAATAVDDLAELTALLDVLAPRHEGTPGGCALGSVTANIGDTRGAAGAASLLKTAMAMTAGIVPPATGCVQPHQLLRAGAAPFRLPAEPEPWPEVTARLAAVNSLGTADLAGGDRSGPVHLVLRRDVEPVLLPGRRRRAVSLLRAAARRSAGAPVSGTPGSPHHAGMRASDANARQLVPPPRQANRGGPEDGPETAGETRPRQPPVSPDPASRPSPAAGADRLAAETVTGDWVIAVRGGDREDLAVTLDAIALTAARLPVDALRDFAVEMAAAPARARFRARAAIVARDPAELAERARKAGATLRERRAGTPGAWSRSAGAGAYVSEGAAGRIALLFPGLVSTGVEHSAVLSASMATLGAAERLGLRPRLGVGYSFGEIAGLAWAGAMTFGEAARLAAHRAEIIRATPRRAAMARVHAGPATVAALCSGTGLTIAVHEGRLQHVVAGPVSDIRDLPQRAAEGGVDTEVLTITHALHSPAMARSAAPMRAVVEGLRFTSPQRRLISTVTGLDITGPADLASLIASQLTRPALLSGALALACADADLILLTARDPSLARIAGQPGRVPVVQAPLDQRPGTVLPSALAAFFAAGAIDSVLPFLPGTPGPPAQAGNADHSPGAGPGQAAGELTARA